MIVDFSEAGKAVLDGRSFDVCIVGAGPAGITLALSLSRTLNILLLEAGDFDASEESQQIYEGTITGHDYYTLDTTRLRYFGGSSNHWGGWCQMLDDSDFQARAEIPYTGWPINRKDLEPYFERAASKLDIDLAEQKPPDFRAKVDRALTASGFVQPYYFLWSPPTQFGIKFRSGIKDSPNIICLLRANLTDILLNESGSAVTDVEIARYGGERTTVPVRRLIIAAGGIENARILLNCDRQIKTGLGNQHDLVGRFFSDHPQHHCGRLILQDDIRNAVLDTFSKGEMHRRENQNYYSAKRQFILDQKILNFVLDVDLAPKERRGSFKQQVRETACTEGLLFVFGNRERKCYDGKFGIATEQAPNPNSRITLIEDKDPFGWRRINLHWQMLPIDKRTIAVAVTEFATRFAAHELGRARVEEWILSDDVVLPGFAEGDHFAGQHHMGTTRMSDDPKQGVVDRDCRVHGISNLYVAGSSVFPTYGFVNPTFTIVQLSLRLANHLNSS